MKKNVIFILLLTILSSCKSEYEEYSGTDAIYLNEISDTVRFSFTYVDSEYETQAQDIHLKVIGKVADYDRPVNIKFTPVNAVEGVDFEPLEKEYVVKVNKKITDTFLKSMADGVYLKELDVTTKPCSISRINNYTFRIILTQGLNRQIRRMCQESGYKVESLTRVRIMNIELGGLKIGEYRIIEGKEKTMLYESL